MPTPTLVLRSGSLHQNFVTTPYIKSGAATVGQFQSYALSCTSPVPGPDGNQCSDTEFKTWNDYFVNAIIFNTILKNTFYDTTTPVITFGGFNRIQLQQSAV